jgi:hypothetical protein
MKATKAEMLKDYAQLEEPEAIGKAIAVLAKEVWRLRHRATARHRKAVEAGREKVAELVTINLADLDDVELPSRQLCELLAVINKPVQGALRHAVKALARHAFEIGGMDMLHQVAEIAERHCRGRDQSRCGSFIDHAFDGIGGWWA